MTAMLNATNHYGQSDSMRLQHAGCAQANGAAIFQYARDAIFKNRSRTIEMLRVVEHDWLWQVCRCMAESVVSPSIGGCLGGRTDGRADGRMDGWMDGRIDG